MKFNLDNPVVEAIVVISVCAGICLVLVLLATFYMYLVAPDKCVAAQNGQVFYDGPGYKLSCSSAGDATSCSIGLIFIDKKVVGKGIEVNCHGE